MNDQPAEKKTRFAISQDAQENFAQGLAHSMAALAQRQDPVPMGHVMPYSPVSGREYSGANMTRLILASMEYGYKDNRWMTSAQIEKLQDDYPDKNIHIRKGEHGIKLLRPQEISYVMTTDNKRHALTPGEVDQLRAQEAEGVDIPEIKTAILYTPYTVFNAVQIENLPDKEAKPPLSQAEQQGFLQEFVAMSGVPVHYEHTYVATYDELADTIVLPSPFSFDPNKRPEFAALMLREFFHATGIEERENRLASPFKTRTIKEHALEEMRTDMFTLMAGQYLGLPQDAKSVATKVSAWRSCFAGTDAKALFHAAAAAGKMLTAMHMVHNGECPKMQWFPATDQWQALQKAQKRSTQEFLARDLLYRSGKVLARSKDTGEFAKVINAYVKQAEPQQLKDLLLQCREQLLSAPVRTLPLAVKVADAIGSYLENPAQAATVNLSICAEGESIPPKIDTKTVKEDDDPVAKVRAILRSPEFLELALKQNPENVREIAAMFGSLANTMSMEMDARQGALPQEEPIPPRVEAPAAPRMRM